MAGFLEGLKNLIRNSPVMAGAMQARYGEGEDPYERAYANAAQLGYPLPNATGDVGEAQRYNSTNLAAKRWGGLPLVTNAFHELVLSPFAEGEGGPNMARWRAGNRGVFDALDERKPAFKRLR